ncbi:S8 family serine peptidase [Aquimarina sp. D1M17]|uniref:S8 family serine peptidase n=1 Tax=Aquimarina acroporae TaxID=2937283 RepID=UPI0020BFC618|nr:S8 family serine peptidase [Aquimarina acroporae]MCK8521354.1 S8 family serine peptidase [Aquimarina acroporae]
MDIKSFFKYKPTIAGGMAMLFVFLFQGCEESVGVSGEDNFQPARSPNQLVVRYNRTFSPIQKDSIRRANHAVSHDTCDCGVDKVELWTIDTTIIDIEESKENLSSAEDGGSGVEGDYQFDFFINNDYRGDLPLSSVQLSSDLFPPITNDVSINIAIVDTGLDYGYFPNPILYDTSRNTICPDQISGWNFVNNTAEIKDDHTHGTYVAKIITDELERTLGPSGYRILPVKAFDNQGKSSYWKIVCAMNYLKQFSDIHIINTSFGYYDISGQKILEDLISELGDKSVIVASSGNRGTNTDVSGNGHFPSGYNLDHILAVGGYSGTPEILSGNEVRGLIMHPRSNFGANTTDVATAFGGYILDLTADGSTRRVNIEGTSFSTALITAKTAALFDRSSPLQLKNYVLNSALFSTSLSSSIEDGKILLPERP